MWQPRYYVFNVNSETKVREKIDYMHNNPVKAGLANEPAGWMYGSARRHLLRKPVGVEIDAAL
jgi:putative transposase